MGESFSFSLSSCFSRLYHYVFHTWGSVFRKYASPQALAACVFYILHNYTVRWPYFPLGIFLNFILISSTPGGGGGVLRYKPEGRGLDYRCSHWDFLLTWSFRQHYDPGVDSASNRNKYPWSSLVSKGGRCVRLTNFSHSCASCQKKSWEPQTPETLRAYLRLYGDN
jgi:hypothetical protein